MSRPTLLGTDDRRQSECSLCGRRARRLTKTHVPPQCAGNTGTRVQRHRILIQSDVASPGRLEAGGLWVRSLCNSCNSLAGKYDESYGELAALLPDNPTPLPRLLLPGLYARIESGAISKGAFARSILFGAFALNPTLRLRWPALAQALMKEDELPPQDDMRIMMATAMGDRCRAHGAIGRVAPFQSAMRDGSRPSLIAMAGVHLRPLAWIVTAPSFYSAADEEGWLDITEWCYVEPSQRDDAVSSLAKLPTVWPHSEEDWVTLIASEGSTLVEGIFMNTKG